MYFAENVLGRLFIPYALNQGFSMVSELRKRNHRDRLAYVRWIMNGRYKVINRSVINAYETVECRGAWFNRLHFFNTDAACGITLVFGKDIKGIESQYYFEYLKNRLLELGYQLHHSYRELSDHTWHVEATDKYFLQNSPKQMRKGRAGIYKGPITLEYICVDNIPSHCKIMIMATGDKKHNSVTDFDSLMSTLFEF
ncbi:MAG: hypothetical protein V4714_04890 [Bacteroidota bacterium]